MRATSEILAEAAAARAALAGLTTEKKNAALAAMADALEATADAILAANALDCEAAAGRISPVMIDRLRLDAGRVRGMADGVRALIPLPDPVGVRFDRIERPNGLVIEKIAIGVLCLSVKFRRHLVLEIGDLLLRLLPHLDVVLYVVVELIVLCLELERHVCVIHELLCDIKCCQYRSLVIRIDIERLAYCSELLIHHLSDILDALLALVAGEHIIGSANDYIGSVLFHFLPRIDISCYLPRTASYMSMAAATAAFRDSILPRIGSVTFTSAISIMASDTPLPSLPILRAMPLLRSSS